MAEQIEIFFEAPLAPGAVPAGLRERAAGRAYLLGRLIIDISFASADKIFSPFIELLKIVGRVVEVRSPIKAEPADIALNSVDIFLLLFERVGVVKPQVTSARELLCNSEVEADGLGMTNMQVTVRLRWKPGNHRAVAAGVEIGPHDIADKIGSAFGGHWLRVVHAATPPDFTASMWQIPVHAPRCTRRTGLRGMNPRVHPRSEQLSWDCWRDQS